MILMSEQKFAVVENGKVVNVIIGVEPEVVASSNGRYIEYTDESPAGIGWSYVDGAFVAPVVEEVTNG